MSDLDLVKKSSNSTAKIAITDHFWVHINKSTNKHTCMPPPLTSYHQYFCLKFLSQHLINLLTTFSYTIIHNFFPAYLNYKYPSVAVSPTLVFGARSFYGLFLNLHINILY